MALKIKNKIKKSLIQNKLFVKSVRSKGPYYRNMLISGESVFKPIEAPIMEVKIPTWEAFHFIAFGEYLLNLEKDTIILLEGKTGLEAGKGKNMSEAIYKARENLNRFAKTVEGFEKIIQERIRENGLSPKFKKD